MKNPALALAHGTSVYFDLWYGKKDLVTHVSDNSSSHPSFYI